MYPETWYTMDRKKRERERCRTTQQPSSKGIETNPSIEQRPIPDDGDNDVKRSTCLSRSDDYSCRTSPSQTSLLLTSLADFSCPPFLSTSLLDLLSFLVDLSRRPLSMTSLVGLSRWPPLVDQSFATQVHNTRATWARKWLEHETEKLMAKHEIRTNEVVLGTIMKISEMNPLVEEGLWAMVGITSVGWIRTEVTMS